KVKEVSIQKQITLAQTARYQYTKLGTTACLAVKRSLLFWSTSQFNQRDPLSQFNKRDPVFYTYRCMRDISRPMW
ncbi:hypothetical protein HispidOSU_019765, partial [Sigmodon hispidus]